MRRPTSQNADNAAASNSALQKAVGDGVGFLIKGPIGECIC